MRYIETNTEDFEPTYNRFQIVAGIITSVALVGVLVGTVLSLASSL